MYSENMDFLNAETLRQKAEELLQMKEQNDEISNEITDLKKLLHELQVHQIELEMQKEELQNAYEATEQALKGYTQLFDLSPLGYFTLDSEGTIQELNFTGAEILGERRFSLVSSNFKLFVSEESIPIFNDFLTRVYTTNSKESCKINLSHNRKSLCSVYIEGVVTENNQKCLLSVVDMSKFKV